MREPASRSQGGLQALEPAFARSCPQAVVNGTDRREAREFRSATEPVADPVLPLGNANSHADRHGQGCPPAPAMQQCGAADLTAALHR